MTRPPKLLVPRQPRGVDKRPEPAGHERVTTQQNRYFRVRRGAGELANRRIGDLVHAQEVRVESVTCRGNDPQMVEKHTTVDKSRVAQLSKLGEKAPRTNRLEVKAEKRPYFAARFPSARPHPALLGEDARAAREIGVQVAPDV